MFGRVLVLGAIAAADMSTAHTQAQVYPAITYFEALLATVTAWRHDVDLIEMLAGSHHYLLLLPDVSTIHHECRGVREAHQINPRKSGREPSHGDGQRCQQA